jgi:hypothetical protein
MESSEEFPRFALTRCDSASLPHYWLRGALRLELTSQLVGPVIFGFKRGKLDQRLTLCHGFSPSRPQGDASMKRA